MTTDERQRQNAAVRRAFAKPYPPQLEDRPGKIAWREQEVLAELRAEFGEGEAA